MSGQTLRLLLLFSYLSSFLGFVWPQALTERPLPSQASPELPPDVLTDQLLTPPLRGIATLRFSPNGRYLLVQDGAGIFVASREPLRPVFYADAPNAYPARFSNDSETISLLTHELILATWRLPDAKAISKRELLLPAGCLDAQLAPGAGWIACLTPEMAVNLYRAGDLANVFSQRIGSGPPPNVIVPIRLYAESAFAAPFGFMLSSTLASLANRGAFRVPAEFSPAGDFLLLSQERNNSLRLDLPNLTRTNLPGAIRKHAFNRFTILPDNSAVLPDLKESSSFSIVSLTSGQTLSKLSLPFDHFSLATNPRYLTGSKTASDQLSLYDLEAHKFIDVPAGYGADVHGETLAVYTLQGNLQFYRVGQPAVVLGGRLPLNELPRLQAVVVDSSLSTLAISVRGSGVIFDLQTGHRLATTPSFSGAVFDSAQRAFLLNATQPGNPPSVALWDGHKSESTSRSQWSAANGSEIFPGNRNFLEYSVHSEFGPNIAIVGLTNEVGFQLRGLDPASGRELWKHAYEKESPVPFNDPQGERLVLGWKAGSGSARNAAKKSPAMQEAYKNQKLKDWDSFFEVVDALTGTSLGGFLVQFGSGPSSFDSAFSCGDAVFLSKDQMRLTVFELHDGKMLARLRGQHPAASASGKLFVLDEGDGKLGLYDLTTAARVGERRFSDGIAYSHFSESGDRLLVLTNHQEAFVLDVKKMLAAAAAPATEPY